MFRLRDTDTGLWFQKLDEDGDIIWTGNKAQALIFSPEKRQWWGEEYGDEVEIIEVGEDEVMGLRGMERLEGF